MGPTNTMMSIKATLCVAIIGSIFIDVQGHHIKCSDDLLPYCECPDGSILTDIDTTINACGRGVKPDSCTCNDGVVINPNCTPSTYHCVDGTTCLRNLCCDGLHRNVVYIECPDGSTFPPVGADRG